MHRAVTAVLATAVVLGAVALTVPPWLERRADERSEERMRAVVDDAHRLRSAILRTYPRLRDVELEQEGREVRILKRGRVLDTVRLAEGDRVTQWSPPPVPRAGWPFLLCVESDDGEWASYDSSDGVVRATGRDGSCELPVVPGVNAPLPCAEPRLRVVDGRVVAEFVLGNMPADFTTWIDVYDGAREVVRIQPWRYRQAVTPIAPGERLALSFVADNGLPGSRAQDCPPITVTR